MPVSVPKVLTSGFRSRTTTNAQAPKPKKEEKKKEKKIAFSPISSNKAVLNST